MKLSPYISDKFIDKVWPRFSADFRNSESKRVYLIDISQFAESIKKDVLEATQEDVDDYMSKLSDKMNAGLIKETTVRKKHHELSALFSFLSMHRNELGLHSKFENYFLKYRPTESREQIQKDRIIDTDQFDQLVGYLRKEDTLCLLAVLFSFKGLLTTGEFMRIHWGDIGVDEQPFVYVKEGTGGKRYNQLTEDVFTLYLDFVQRNHKGYLFSKNGVEPFETRTMQKRLAKACRIVFKDGVAFTFNDLRNSGIAAANTNGASAEAIADMIGMSSRKHIERLRSGVFKLNEGAKYINIEIKPLSGEA